MAAQRWLQMAAEAHGVGPRTGMQHLLAEAIEQLLSDAPEARKIREWLQSRYPPGANPGLGGLRLLGYCGPLPLECDHWEVGLYDLAVQFAFYPRLSAWDMTERESRSRHARTVARHARALADAMEDDPVPDYPPLLALLSEDDALSLAESMPGQQQFIAGYGLTQPPPLDTAARRLAFSFPDPRLPAVLRRLAEWADAAVHLNSPVARPKTGDPQARVFARNLSEYMTRHYGSPFDRVVADCVALKYPAIDSPSEETIRKWLGRK